MKKIVIIVCFFFLVTDHIVAQAGQYSFQVTFLKPDNTTIPASYYELSFNGNVVKTNSTGMIYYTRQSGTRAIAITLLDPDYSLVGPQSIGYPEDAGMVSTIVLHKKSETEKAYKTLVKLLNSKSISIEDAISRNTRADEQIKEAIDSVLKVVTEKYHISNNDLRKASEILAGRDKYFPLISSSLEVYLNEAKDIRDIFRNMLAFSLENPKSFFLFDSTIHVYNDSYSALNTNNNEYEKAVETYWESPELASGFHNVFDYAINNIHRTNILVLNTLFIQKANFYIHEKNKKRRKALKKEIINTLNSVIPILDNNLVVLENKIKYFIGKLEVEKEIFRN